TGAEGRNLRRHYGGRPFFRRAARVRRRAEGGHDSLHAAGYGRALSEHTAVRGYSRRHDRRGDGYLALDALRAVRRLSGHAGNAGAGRRAACALIPFIKGISCRNGSGGDRQSQTGREAMKIRATGMLAIFAWFAFLSSALAQDLGPQVRKLGDGIYVYVGKDFYSNSGIVLTQDGVVVIDTGQNPIESRAILEVVRKLTPMPVRFVVDTEPHPDHTTGHFVFSPPAVVIAAAGAGESMRGREREDPQRIQKMAAASPQMGTALEGYRFIPPHVEYQQKMTLNLGER